MRNIKKEIAEILTKHVESMTAEEIETTLENPVDSTLGDYAFPCFKLAKEMRKAPQMIAKDIAEVIIGEELFSKAENVNAYVNMFIDGKTLAAITLSDVVERKDDFGRSTLGGNKPVIVEFSSPNIAKPFHIGHIRTTVIGNSIYKIHDFLGYKTIRINHLGDYGTQFGKMIVAYRHWGNKEDVTESPISTLLSYYIKFHEEVEKNPGLDDEAREVFSKLENGSEEETALWQWFRDESLTEFARVYKMLDIEFDSYAGESFYSDKMGAVRDTMREKGILKKCVSLSIQTMVF
jgi:arginyl-tRNA synthetase